MRMWHFQITESATGQELLDVARGYIASLSPQEWASVPQRCRPNRIKGIDDLDFWHRRLAEEFLDVAVRTRATDTHRRMLAFFTAAAERSTEMCGTALPQDKEAVHDFPGGRSGEERRRWNRG